MPADSIGVIVFTIGDHTASLYNTVTFNIYERLLGIDESPWSERRLKDRMAGKQEGTERRSKAGTDRVENTKPSHPLEDYTGQFEHPAYGILKISSDNNELKFDFHKIILPLNHYHYDRFDTPDDENYGKWSVNFLTNPQGELDKVLISLDEGEVTFTRKADASLTDPDILAQYLGKYELAGGIFEIVLKDNTKLNLVITGQPNYELIPYKKNKFVFKQFSDMTISFIEENAKITALEIADPSGVSKYIKK